MGVAELMRSVPHKFFPDFSRIFVPAIVDKCRPKGLIFSSFFRIFVLLSPDKEVNNTVLI